MWTTWRLHPLGPAILCPVGRGVARERPESSSARAEAPTSQSRLVPVANFLRGSLASHVFLLLIGGICVGSNQS